MSETAVSLEAKILAALSAVAVSELGQPINELGFVQSVSIDDNGVTVHLRLPAGQGWPNSSHPMATKSQNAPRGDKVDARLATDMSRASTSDSEAHERLSELPRAALRRAHRAAVERCVSALMQRDALDPTVIHRLILRDMPEGVDKAGLLRLRYALGLSMCHNSRVLVDDDGRPLRAEELPMRLRLAGAS